MNLSARSIAVGALLVFAPLEAGALDSNRSIVSIDVERKGKTVETGLGILVAERIVLTSQRLFERGDRVLVKFDTQQVVGKIKHADLDGDFAILEIPPIADIDVIPFSKSMPSVERQVDVLVGAAAMIPGQLVEGNFAGGLLLQPVVALNEGAYMKAVLNNCGELVGVIDAPPPQRRRQEPTNPPLPLFPLASVTAFLAAANVTPKVAVEECLAPAEQKAQLEQGEREASAKLEEERAKLEEAQATARQHAEAQEQAEETLDETKKALDEKARVVAEQEKVLKEAQEALEKKNEEIKQAQQEIEEKKEVVVQTQDQKAAAEAEAEARRRQNYMLAGVAALLFLLCSAAMVAVSRRRRALQAESLKANQLQSRLNVTNQKLSAASVSFSDVLLSGADEEGLGLRLRINGPALARAADGQVFGRHPEACQLVISHPEISREHLRFKVEDGALWVSDLKTVNGTSLNGSGLQPMVPAKLQDGDTLEIGGIKLGVRFL